MGNQNRKAKKQEMSHARRVIREAFPEFVPVFGAHSDYGGHRAPRDHTIAFRLQVEAWESDAAPLRMWAATVARCKTDVSSL